MEVAVIDWKNLDSSFRDASLKNKGQVLQPGMSLNKDAKSNRVVGDSENQNPNFMTPPRLKAKVLKEAIKSSMEREAVEENSLYREQTRRLRSTLSARNLFGGGGLMNKVSEFCNELKKLASRAREKERVENENVERTPTMANKQKVKAHFGDEIKGLDDEKPKERKPLLELSKEKCEANASSAEKQTKKLGKADAENTPIRVDVKNIKPNLDESLMQIRTSPPTPQCFSATKGTTPHNAPRSKPQERGILQELRRGSGKDGNNGSGKKSNHGGGHVSSILTERGEARGLDVLWEKEKTTSTRQQQLCLSEHTVQDPEPGMAETGINPARVGARLSPQIFHGLHEHIEPSYGRNRKKMMKMFGFCCDCDEEVEKEFLKEGVISFSLHPRRRRPRRCGDLGIGDLGDAATWDSEMRSGTLALTRMITDLGLEVTVDDGVGGLHVLRQGGDGLG
nr:uncharacterized protein LOC109181294 [Ipomoea batatas]